jgi:hypothetical protein
MEKTEDSFFYTNAAAIFSSEDDFVIKFIRKIPVATNSASKEYAIKTDEVNIYMSPNHFRKLFEAMKTQIEKHEKKYLKA